MALSTVTNARAFSFSAWFIGTELSVKWTTRLDAVLVEYTKVCDGSHYHCKGEDIMWTSGLVFGNHRFVFSVMSRKRELFIVCLLHR